MMGKKKCQDEEEQHSFTVDLSLYLVCRIFWFHVFFIIFCSVFMSPMFLFLLSDLWDKNQQQMCCLRRILLSINRSSSICRSVSRCGSINAMMCDVQHHCRLPIRTHGGRDRQIITGPPTHVASPRWVPTPLPYYFQQAGSGSGTGAGFWNVPNVHVTVHCFALLQNQLELG